MFNWFCKFDRKVCFQRSIGALIWTAIYAKKDDLFASVSNIAGSDDMISPVFGSYRFRDEHDVQVGFSGGEDSLVEQ